MKKAQKERHKIGSRVKQKILNKYVPGTITEYEKDREYYMIEYDNGDSEELTYEEAKQILFDKDLTP